MGADECAGWQLTRGELWEELLFATSYDPHVIGLAATHEQPRVRALAAGDIRSRNEPFWHTLLADDSAEVREAVAGILARENDVRDVADLPTHRGHFYWDVLLNRPLSRALVDHIVAGGTSTTWRRWRTTAAPRLTSSTHCSITRR